MHYSPHNESLLFIRFIFGLAYYYQTYFSNWVELSFRIRDECFILDRLIRCLLYAFRLGQTNSEYFYVLKGCVS